MKTRVLAALAVLSLAPGAFGQASAFYVNDGVVLCPPQIPPDINATNFINNNQFVVNKTNLNAQPYETQSTLNYTNRSWMECNMGFRFETYTPPQPRRMAANWVNTGTVFSGVQTNITAITLSPNFPSTRISATNIIAPGPLNVGYESLLRMSGQNIDVSRGSLFMEGFEGGTPFAFPGLFDNYWGIGTNTFTPYWYFQLAPPTSPYHQVTLRNYGTGFEQLALANSVAYVDDQTFGSNRLVLAVFIANTNTTVANQVYFNSFPPSGYITVTWRWLSTNAFTGQVTTNGFDLQDDLLFYPTPMLFPNGTAGARLTYQPYNFWFTRYQPGQFYGPPALPGLPANTFGAGIVTNEWAAYEALFLPTTRVPGDYASGNITNVPGRTELVAGHTLNAELSRVTALNYFLLSATNHFQGSRRAQILSPYSDIYLRSTNGLLEVTNLLVPKLARAEGTIQLYSTRWTTVTGSITNTFHVLLVDSRFSPSFDAKVQTCRLQATNVFISDVLNVTSNIVVEAEHLTLTTNSPGAPTRNGALALLNPVIVWPNVTPTLRFLTNQGGITTLNAVFFGGSRRAPFFTTNYNEPYEAFVNHGSVSNYGSLIWSKYFENTGRFFAGSGSVELYSWDARLTDGSFLAPTADVVVTAGGLVISNHALLAGRRLVLDITNSLWDGGLTNGNAWRVGEGFNLLSRPASGSLLGTVVTSTTPAYVETASVWAGEDRGTVAAGFDSNCALGLLVLDAGENGLFTFRGALPGSALYADYLELRNFMTNRDAAGNLEGLQIDPNLRIYYGDAVVNGVSVAEKLNHTHGDRLRWVSSYAGYYSGTNFVYPDGTTNLLNRALVTSCNLDSDGDQIVNCQDLTPVWRANEDIGFRAETLGSPATAVGLSWRTLPGAANQVFYKASLTDAQWTLLTEFTTPAGAGSRVSVSDPVDAGRRFYRVVVTPALP